MNDGRKHRRAKQGRRDARRTSTGEREIEPSIADFVRTALAGGHPLHLLGLAGYLIHTATPDRFAFQKSRQREPLHVDKVVTGLINTPGRELTALLAVLAELIDDEDLRDRCRREVATRRDHLPKWVFGLPHVQVYRAVRRTDVFGDGDELVVGARLVGGSELTVAVYLDHAMLSEVKDATIIAESIDTALCAAIERNTDPDATYIEMSLADARAWIEYGLEQADSLPQSDSWPELRPLIRWVIGHLPEGGSRDQRPGWGYQPMSDLLDTFFATRRGAQFNDYEHRDLLESLLDTRTGDPLRWSAARIGLSLDGSAYHHDELSLEVVLDAPDLLRAFVPFAHAQSGIRQDLTADTVASIDDLAPGYRRAVHKTAECRSLAYI